MIKKLRDRRDNNRQETSDKKRIKVTKLIDPQATPQDENTLQRGRKCLHCDVTKTPQWRAGPMGPNTLCNACGVRYKSGRLFPEYRPSASPTFVPDLHSNSHRKVVEMRRKVEPGDAVPTPEDPKVVPDA